MASDGDKGLCFLWIKISLNYISTEQFSTFFFLYRKFPGTLAQYYIGILNDYCEDSSFLDDVEVQYILEDHTQKKNKDLNQERNFL